MDESVMDRLDRLDVKYIFAIATEIRDGLRNGGTVECDFQPGDMTRYGLVFTRLDEHVKTVGSGRHAYLGLTSRADYQHDDGWVQVALVNFGSVYPFRLLHRGEVWHTSYVNEKLFAGRQEGSAAAITALFNAISESE